MSVPRVIPEAEAAVLLGRGALPVDLRALNETLLHEKTSPVDAFLPDGGIEAWEAAALPLARP